MQTGADNEPAARQPKTIDKDVLISAITGIAIAGNAADERRRIEIISKTLEDSVEKLKDLGYNMKRSSTYLQLIPRRKNPTEGQRHLVSKNQNIACSKLWLICLTGKYQQTSFFVVYLYLIFGPFHTSIQWKTMQSSK